MTEVIKQFEDAQERTGKKLCYRCYKNKKKEVEKKSQIVEYKSGRVGEVLFCPNCG